MDASEMIAEDQMRRAKLPVWAREKIRGLEQTQRYLEERVAELLVPVGEAIVTRGSVYDIPVGAVGDRFHFHPSETREQFTVWLDADGELQINASRGIAVYPGASNTVAIQLKGRV